MKNKPHSHRTSNTYRFQGFHEKIKSIKVNARNFVLNKLDSENENETLLWHTIHNLRDENATGLFQEFQKALGTEIQILSQLLLHEERISTTIRCYLESADPLSLPAIAKALIAFSRDTENVFYANHFYDFIQILIRLVSSNVSCHEIIENLFLCFVSLFYTFQKYLLNDFQKLFFKYEFCTLFGKQFPHYVNELAAQSTCLLIRKKDNEEIIRLCLKRVNKYEDEADGIGLLFFHSMKADVARRLHSTSGNTFSLLLDSLKEEKNDLDITSKVISVCLKQLILHVSNTNVNVPVSWNDTWRQDCKYVWDVIFEKFKEVEKLDEITCSDESFIRCLIGVILQLTEFKSCVLVTDFNECLNILTSVSKMKITDETGKLIAKTSTNLISSSQSDISEELLEIFLKSFFEESFYSYSVVFYFVDLVTTLELFDAKVLTLYLRYIVFTLSKADDTIIKANILESLFKLVNSNVSPVRTMDDMELWSRYVLNFTDLEMKNSPAELLSNILFNGLSSDLSNLEEIIKACVCIPHVLPMVVEDIVPHLFCIMDDALDRIQKQAQPLYIEEEQSYSKRKKKRLLNTSLNSANLHMNVNTETNEKSLKLIFLCSILVESLHHLIDTEDFLRALSDMRFLTVLKDNVQYRENVHLLKSLDIHFSVLMEKDDDLIKESTLKEIYPILAPSLASHKPLVRLLVSHIFSLFSYESVPNGLSSFQSQNMFIIMYEVESSPVSPLEYKERLRLLSRLDCNNANLSRPLDDLYEQAPLLFLIGQLNINFKDMWQTIIKSITQYAYALPEEPFWKLWVEKLKISSHYALRTLCNKTIKEDTETSFEDSSLQNYHSDLVTHPGYSHLNAKPNYRNFRDLLWRAMHQFPDICERRNKDVVTLFMNFLHNELFPVDFDVAPTQDISVQKDEDEEDIPDDDIDEEENSQEEDQVEVDPRQRVRKAPTQSLCEHLALFAKFHNPKVIYKSKELETIYCEFLCHPYVKAQKLALDAIMTYNHKFIIPYKESLYNILDDKNFKNEITLFDIEGNREDKSKSLQKEHRKDFMPFLMRILYGKMQYKTGSHTSGKSNIRVRKGIILRFLAGAMEDELDTFLNLSFDILVSHINGTALDVVERVQKNLDPTKVVPLKRMRGALGTIDSILDKIGHLLENKRGYMLKIILFILSTSVGLIENASVCSKFLPSLKNMRQLSVQKVVMFFTSFENYRWSEVEVEAVFRSVVWPSLPKLPDEGIYSPTPLLQLFLCWGENPAFHILLARHKTNDIDMTPMPYIMKLINHAKCSSKVVNTVFDLVDKLLNGPKCLTDNETEVEIFEPFELPLKNILPIIQEAKCKSSLDLSVGESLVWSCMDKLLVNIRNSLINLKKDSEINKRELTILIRIGKWIKEENDAVELLGLVIPLLKKNCVRQGEKVVLLLDICCNLFGIVENSEQYIKGFIGMFSVFDDRKSRQALCNVIKSICKERHESLRKWCYDLNSFSGEMLDEVDAETRLKCFREVNKYMSEIDKFDELIVLFLINQNFWVLNHAGSQGFTDLSVLCLQSLIEMLSRLHKDYPSAVKRIIEQRILPPIKSGLKNKSEISRTSMMSILGKLVHKCYKLNRRLEDLFQLADLNDPDGDFFTNMQHLQLSRRAKALSRLTSHLKEEKIVLQVETITEIILPVASAYLFKDEFASEGYLLDSCVTCIGILAKQLPWPSYQHLLKNYLDLMSKDLKHLKLAVRVLETILDAFHEDLTMINTSITDNECINGAVTDEPDENNDVHPNFRERLLATNETGERVYWSLKNIYIPKLQKVLSQKSLRDSEHKVNKKKYPEDEDIKRIPLALALVKLLKKLPRNVLLMHVNSVLLILINYLKSKLDSIRREAREMLVKVMKELGGEFLPYVVQDMKNILVRGYQTHVLVYTLHAILSPLEDSLSPNDVASCVDDIMEMCIEDIFGDKAEEKAVSQITNKVFEAKLEKGYAIMGILAQFIAVDHINNIISPLKEKLKTYDKKVVNKVACCLQKIGAGLQRNKFISIKHKSLFVYSNLQEKLKELSLNDNLSKESLNQKSKSPYTRTDSFLIEPEPRKVGLKPKTNFKTSFHILVEFSLSLLSDMIKHDHFLPTNEEHCSLLDAYVEFMSQLLLSEYPDVSIQALHVISGLIKFPLPSIKKHIKKIFSQMFVILNKFASSGLTNGKLFTLVQLDFKVLSLIIKDISFFKVEPDHSKVLIHYSKINLDDYNQYHSSFIILNAFINKKFSCQELHDLMFVIRDMSILSTNLNMVDQARRTYLNYITNYHKKKSQLVEGFMFFVKNLSYSVHSGRMSAILSVQELISKGFTSRLDAEDEIAVLIIVAEQLLKENLKEHKMLLRKLLKLLYAKSAHKNVLTDNCSKLLKGDLLKSSSENALAVHMGIETLLPMLEGQSSEETKNVTNQLVPKIIELLHPSRFQVGVEETEKELKDIEDEQCYDLALISLLDFILMVVESNLNNNNLVQWAENINVDLWKHIQKHLLYPNLKVRFTSSVIFGKLFAAYPSHESLVPHIASTNESARSLIVSFCDQLTTECSVESPILNELGLVVIRNLVYLIRQGKKVPINKHNKRSSINKIKSISDFDEEKGSNNIDLNIVDKGMENSSESLNTLSYLDGAYWVLRKVGILAYDELKVKGKNSTLIRECLLNLIAALVVVLSDEIEKAPKIISFIVNHITRELSDKSLPESLTLKTKEVSELVREKVGAQKYNEERVRCQTILDRKRTKRKAIERERFISNPEMAMKKKAKIHANKKESKKRKYVEHKLKPNNKKRRLKDHVIINS